MNTQFVRSIRSVSTIKVETLSPESAKSLTYFCRELLVQSDDIKDASLKERVKRRIAEKLLAAHKRSKNSAS